MHQRSCRTGLSEICEIFSAAAEEIASLDAVRAARGGWSADWNHRDMVAPSHGQRLSDYRPGPSRPVCLEDAVASWAGHNHCHRHFVCERDPGRNVRASAFHWATLGGAVGGFEHVMLHRPVSTVAAFALVGMGAFFAAFLRVPITSVWMVVELS